MLKLRIPTWNVIGDGSASESFPEKNPDKKFLNISEDSWSTYFDMPVDEGPTSCGIRKSCACCSCCQKKAMTRCKPFISINVIAAGGHLINFLIALFSSTSNGQENDTQLRHFYSQWGVKQKYCNKTCPSKFYTVTATLDGINETYKNSDGTTDFVVNPFATKEANTLNLFSLVIAFHLLSFVFQMFVAFNYKSCSDRCCKINYVSNVLNRGVNSWRFIEYSISATIMLVSICIISGILDFTAILCVGIFTFVTQLLGLVSEILFQDDDPLYERRLQSLDSLSVSSENRKDSLRKKFLQREARPVKLDYKNQMRCMGWAVHFIGWITMFTAYLGILMTHFYISNGSTENENTAPDFVQVAIWSIFIFYNLFGVTQISQLLLKDNCGNRNCCSIPKYYFLKTEGYDGARAGISGTQKCPCISVISINEWVELFYVILSLSSKTVLGTLILVNALRDNVTFTNRESC